MRGCGPSPQPAFTPSMAALSSSAKLSQLAGSLPSGQTRTGTVFYRGADAAYATQRDVSRTKRDVRTFEIRLRCDNTDRRMAAGMTAYVLLPLQ